MTKLVGLWIDHARAQIVTINGTAEPKVLTLDSEVEHRHRSTGNEGPALPGQLHGGQSKHYEHRREQEKIRFYDDVLKQVATADELVVLGPGLAKTEFQRHLQRHKHRVPRIRTLLPADNRHTEAQLIAKVKNLYADRPEIEVVPRKTPVR